MATAGTIEGKADAPSEDAARALARLASLAGASISVDAFVRQAARLLAAHFGASACEITLRHHAQDIGHNWSSTATPAWRAHMEAALLDVRAEPRAIGRLYDAGDTRVGLLAAPVSGEVSGGLVMLVEAHTERDLELLLAELRSAAAVVAAGVAACAAGRGPAKGAPIAASADAIQRASVYRSLEEFAFALTNNLRNKLGAESVAFATPAGARARLVAVSGIDEVKRRSPGTVAMRQALEECLDQKRTLCAQRDDAWADDRVSTGHPLHKAWSAAAGGATVLSVPMFAGEELAGLVAIRKRADELLSGDDIASIEKLLEPFGVAVPMVRRATRSIARHTIDAIGSGGRRACRPGAWGSKAVALGATAMLAWVALGTAPYSVRARALVAPAERVQIAVPFEGAVADVLVRAGDRVEAGQVLAVLDTRDLELERSQLNAESRALRVRADGSAAKGDMPAAALAGAERRAVLARLASVEARLAAAHVRAPADGLIIRGDPRERIGQMLPVGEPMFEFAPSDGLRVEILAPEHAADELGIGLDADFAPEARPGDLLPLRIERVEPAAGVRDGTNVVSAYGELAAGARPEWLRPGMEGTARVRAGERPVWWILSHRVVDAVHARFMP